MQKLLKCIIHMQKWSALRSKYAYISEGIHVSSEKHCFSIACQKFKDISFVSIS